MSPWSPVAEILERKSPSMFTIQRQCQLTFENLCLDRLRPPARPVLAAWPAQAVCVCVIALCVHACRRVCVMIDSVRGRSACAYVRKVAHSLM